MLDEKETLERSLFLDPRLTQLDLVELALAIVRSRDGFGESVIVVETELIEGRGIWRGRGRGGDGHCGEGAPVNCEDPVGDRDVDWQPLGPGEGGGGEGVNKVRLSDSEYI